MKIFIIFLFDLNFLIYYGESKYSLTFEKANKYAREGFNIIHGGAGGKEIIEFNEFYSLIKDGKNWPEEWTALQM